LNTNINDWRSRHHPHSTGHFRNCRYRVYKKIKIKQNKIELN